MKITQALLAEHVVFHNLFDYLERTVPKLETVAEVRALASLLASMLKMHSQVEDDLLIQPLEPSFCQLGHHENFHEEHDEIEEDLELIRTTRTPAQSKRLLIRAVASSRRHFDKEERIVFALAERQLSAESLKLLGRQWVERRTLTLVWSAAEKA